MPKSLYLLSFILLLSLACSNAPATPVVATPAPMPTVTPMPAPTATPIPIPSPLPAPKVNEITCPFDVPADMKITCGTMVVPAKRSQPNGATLKLAYAILHASDTPQPDPILYLEGGPGGSPLDSLASDPYSWSDYSYVNNRDVILLDQRGTGYSEPSLNCPEEEEGILDDPTRVCYDRLMKAGIDLSAYNTVDSAADVADLWHGLGYQQVNLFGVSYGTRLALAVMRYHPNGIRSVVLDSVYPPNEAVPDEEALLTLNSMRRMVADCARQAECAAAYPDLEEVLRETVKRLNEESDFVILGEDEEETEITGDDFVGTLFEAMYDVELLPLLPRAIYEVSEGEYEVYDILVNVDDYYYYDEESETVEEGESDDRSQVAKMEDRSDSEGMYYAMSCNDEYPFANLERAKARLNADVPAELQSAFDVEPMFETCATWGAKEAPASENEAVVSDLPTLILAGTYDPVTPLEMAQLAAKTLSHAQLFEFPGYGHSISSDVDCPTSLITQFYNNPAVNVDSRCWREIEPPYFYLPDDELDF